MIKYIPEDTSVVFAEVPDEITLAINISNCQNNCRGCHSPYLKEDIGEELTEDILKELIIENDGVTCVALMGEGNDLDTIIKIANYIKNDCGKKVALYSGRISVPEDIIWNTFDYIKVGPYVENCGPLSSETTNQRMYRNCEDLTSYIECGDICRKGYKDITKKYFEKAWQQN